MQYGLSLLYIVVGCDEKDLFTFCCQSSEKEEPSAAGNDYYASEQTSDEFAVRSFLCSHFSCHVVMCLNCAQS